MSYTITNRQMAAFLVDRLRKDGIISDRLVRETLQSLEDEINQNFVLTNEEKSSTIE